MGIRRTAATRARVAPSIAGWCATALATACAFPDIVYESAYDGGALVGDNGDDKGGALGPSGPGSGPEGGAPLSSSSSAATAPPGPDADTSDTGDAGNGPGSVD